MPFEIVRNDITNICVDAIVNSAKPRPVEGLGTESSIHEKAGPELLAARQKIGPISMGQAAITPALKPEYNGLFTDAERKLCKDRLEQFGYHIG